MTPAYDRELLAEVVELVATMPKASKMARYDRNALREQARLLREAANAEAASVETVNSRSRLRRIAAEKGEPAPRFDTSEDRLPELPEHAASLYVEHFRDCPSMRNTDWTECVEFWPGTHRLYTAAQMHTYGEQCRRLAASGQGVE